MNRIVHILLISICLSAAEMAPETNVAIRTSTATYLFTPLPKLKGEDAMRSALQTAELAASAVMTDIETSKKEEKTLEEDEKTFQAKLAKDVEKWNKVKDDYEKAQDDFRRWEDDYVERVRVWLEELQRYHAERIASNALSAEQRSSATIQRLEQWRDSLEAERADAESEFVDENAKFEEQERQTEDFRQAMITKHTAPEKRLIDRREVLEGELDSAYKQLEQCHKYAIQIREILQWKFKDDVSTPQGKVWNGVDELLKERSNQEFDGNTPQPKLQVPNLQIEEE